MSQQLVPPHGGRLKPLLAEGEELKQERERARSLQTVRLTSRETSDLIMMAMGAFSPLEGFMGKDDYTGVVENMHMADRTLWPVPITLSVSKNLAEKLSIGSEIALADDDSGELMGSMKVTEKFTYDKRL
ncbi:MAG: sulfate adenylyltransferase, partial [Candidatus Aminicenantes bacterium]|nr:sulfate adenylyltransferase [Candidatus Aminicenantes bacterium]